jgi:hypothetical protein
MEMHAFWKAAGDAGLEQGGSWCQLSIDRADVSHDCGNVSAQEALNKRHPSEQVHCYAWWEIIIPAALQACEFVTPHVAPPPQ